jgi:glycosyltransferase involved in cell wall biosynthesis
MRLLIVTTHAIQYYAPLYRELSRRPGLELKVAYATDCGLRASFDRQFGMQVRYDRPLGDGYEYVVLPEHVGCESVPGPLGRRNWSVRLHVREADAVYLASFLSVTDLVAAASAAAAGKPIIYRSESTLLTPRGRMRDLARGLVMPMLFDRVAACLYIGRRNREYLRRFGVPEDRLFFSPYCVDNDFFVAEAARLAPRREELRASFGLVPGLPVALFSGKLIPKKQPLLLLEAFEKVQATVPSQLLVVGDGELRSEFEQAVVQRRIPRVTLTGFVNQSRIPEAYAAADLLVLPSNFEETWGLVMNEAMCFGLPVLASDLVGGAADLVTEGLTGRVFDHRSADSLAQVLGAMLGDAGGLVRMGVAARTRVAEYSIQRAADGIVAALDSVAGSWQ